MKSAAESFIPGTASRKARFARVEAERCDVAHGQRRMIAMAREFERLFRGERIFAPATQRFLDAAGLSPGHAAWEVGAHLVRTPQSTPR